MRCMMTFPHHFVVPAVCSKPWRGHNFDAAAAEGNVGAAVAEVLGVRVRTTSDLEAFLKRAFVRAYDFGDDHYEFHVGIRDASVDAARVERAAREAVEKSRNFSVSGPA